MQLSNVFVPLPPNMEDLQLYVKGNDLEDMIENGWSHCKFSKILHNIILCGPLVRLIEFKGCIYNH